MKPRGISAFSGPSFHLASMVGRSSQTGRGPVEQGEDDGLAHMHLDTLSLSQAAHQSGQTSAFATSLGLTAGQSEGAEDEGEGLEGGESADAAPTFLLADGTPGIFAMDDGDGDDGGDGGDGEDGD